MSAEFALMCANGLLREINLAAHRSLASGDVGRIGPVLTLNCGHPPATWNAINSVHAVKVGLSIAKIDPIFTFTPTLKLVLVGAAVQ
jgi:hypothetical protein